MLSSEFIRILRCPETFQSLALAEVDVIARLNEKIGAGRVRNRAAQTLTKPLDGGLTREDGRVLYPIIDETPILLADEGIELQTE
jgi:uncharacterized protein YbaR (Trm112 family)